MSKQSVCNSDSKSFGKMLLIEAFIFVAGIGISILTQSDLGVGIASIAGVVYFFAWMFFGPIKPDPAPKKKQADHSRSQPYGELQDIVEFCEDVEQTAKAILLDEELSGD